MTNSPIYTTDTTPGAERTREFERLISLPCFTDDERRRGRAKWAASDFTGQCRAIHALIQEAQKRGHNATAGPPPIPVRPDWWPEYLAELVEV